jgi:hypothetical protein
LTRTLVNAAGFQAAWWATILSAAAGRPLVAAAASAIPLGLHLALFDRSAAERRLVAATAAVGALLETANALLGFTRFDPPPLGLPLAPAWMLLQWALLGAVLRHSFGWIRGRYALAALLGAVAAPLSYAGGERLGALSLGGTPALAAVAVEYALALPALAWAARRAEGPAGPPGPAAP